MNRYSAYPHPIPGGKFWAMLRLCRDAHPSPIMDEDDKPKVFHTKGEAAEECLRHVISFMNGKPIRGETFETGEYTRANAAKAMADQLFKTKDEECAA